MDTFEIIWRSIAVIGIIAFWVGCIYLTGVVARRKGYSFGWGLFFGWLFWFWALVVVLIIPRKVEDDKTTS